MANQNPKCKLCFLFLGQLLLFFPLLLLLLVGETGGKMGGPRCDPNKYSIPYARVHKKRNGPSIDEDLVQTGFRTLIPYIHKLLCINGPAILYYGYTLDTGYTNGDVQYFSHDCFVINQLKTPVAMDVRDAILLLQSQNNKDPTISDFSPVDFVNSNLTYGVYLIATFKDYYIPTALLFPADYFNHNPITSEADPPVTAASFITVGAGACFLVGNTSLHFNIKFLPESLTENAVCSWSYPNITGLSGRFRKRYSILFNGTRPASEFRLSYCGVGGTLGPGLGLGPYPISTVRTTTPQPFTIKYDAFSFLDSKEEGNRVYYDDDDDDFNGFSGPISKDFIMPKLTNKDGTSAFQHDYDPGAPVDFDIYFTPPNCILMNQKPKGKPIDCPELVENATCHIFNEILDIGPDPGDFQLDGDLEWKKEILDKAGEIFGNICEPFPREMPFLISRILEYYLARAHAADALNKFPRKMNPEWNFLLSELDRCNNKSIDKHFLWYWDNREDLLSPPPPQDDSADYDLEFDSVDSYDDDPGGLCKSYCLGGYCLNMTMGRCAVRTACPDPICLDKDPVKNCKLNIAVGSATIGSCEPLAEALANATAAAAAAVEGTASTCNPGFDCSGGCTIASPAPTSPASITDYCLPPALSLQICNFMACEDPNTCMLNPDPNEPKHCIPIYKPFDPDASPVDYPAQDSPFVRYPIQEVFTPKKNHVYNFEAYGKNVVSIAKQLNKGVSGRRKRRSIRGQGDHKKGATLTTTPTPSYEEETQYDVNKDPIDALSNKDVIVSCLFFYSDAAETNYELNIAIDIFWKIWTTVIGHCNKHYVRRQSETFPRLHNTFYQDFFLPIIDDWRYPQENEALKVLLSEFNSEISQRWLDICLESAFDSSNTSSFRPPRPLDIGRDNGTATLFQANYFEALPNSYAVKYQTIDSQDLYKQCPEI